MRRDSRRKDHDRYYQFKICLWLALGKSDTQIIHLLRDKFNIEMSRQNVNENYRHGSKWIPIINYLRTRYLNNISRIPIANKAYRLQLLQEAGEDALTWHRKSINQYGTVDEKKIGIIASLVKEARTEVEGEKPLVDQSLHVTIHDHVPSPKKGAVIGSNDRNLQATT